MTWGSNGTGDQTASLLQKSDAEIKDIITNKIRLALPPTKNNNPKLVIVSSTPIRYAWNMCTFGYSSTFWDWKRWQRELDWFFQGLQLMAPLAWDELTKGWNTHQKHNVLHTLQHAILKGTEQEARIAAQRWFQYESRTQ